MKATIDRAGRLVIPRDLRARIGLAHGGRVQLEIDGAAIRIEPDAGNDLVEEDGFMVIPATGEAIVIDDVRELIDADRFRHG